MLSRTRYIPRFFGVIICPENSRFYLRQRSYCQRLYHPEHNTYLASARWLYYPTSRRTLPIRGWYHTKIIDTVKDDNYSHTNSRTNYHAAVRDAKNKA
jgi:hypothetical protein